MVRIGDTMVDESSILAMEPLGGRSGVRIYVDGVAQPLEVPGVDMDRAQRAVIWALVRSWPPSRAVTGMSLDETQELLAAYQAGARYAARDKDGEIWAYTDVPEKGAEEWSAGNGGVIQLEAGPYRAIRWEAPWPKALADLLKEVILP